MKLRIAVVISHPIQHFAPMFRDLAKQPGVDLKVFFCCDWGTKTYYDPGFEKEFAWNVPLLEGYDYEFLPIARRPKRLGFWEVDNPTVTRKLETFAPKAVWVHGYAHRTSWRVNSWAKKHSRILYFGDSELLSKRTLPARVIKRLILPWLFKQCHAFITIGDNNEAYYRHYGVPEEKMFRGAYPVDIERFRRAIEMLSADDRALIRSQYGLRGDSIVTLFAGKFIPIKRPLDFVEAMWRLKQQNVPYAQALMIGDGALRDRISLRIDQLGLRNEVKMAGFLNQSEMPAAYFCGDIIAVCSEKDPHPLVVTEAMSVGNVVVASDRVGCVGASDAARPGVNAMVYPIGDVDNLARNLRSLIENAALRRRMSQASVKLADTQDTQITVNAILRAVSS